MHPLRPEDPRRLGPYRLLRRVGSGGMGVVFLAVAADGTGDDLAAVKAVRTEYAEDPEFRARFAGEVALARRVRGPYTARVLDADTEGPRPWLATEYVSGPSLHQAVREGGPFPEDSLLALAAGLARALDAIHSVGLIHRDLKPSNVLLSTRGPQVIDFGIARATDATALTRTGQTLGTPAFMSPEQATGAYLGPGSDLFAFGGVLLFAGTGRHPFGTGDPAALLYRVVNEEPDLSGLPEGLLPLVTACLAKDASDRPGPESLLADLTGTALPEGGADDPTAWLPTAIATRVRGTVAYTRRQVAAPDPVAERAEPQGSAEHGGGSETTGATGTDGPPATPETRGPAEVERGPAEANVRGTGTASEASPGGAEPGNGSTVDRGEGSAGADGASGNPEAHETPVNGRNEPPGARDRNPGELPSWARTRSYLPKTASAERSPEAEGDREPEAAEKPRVGGSPRREPPVDRGPVRRSSSNGGRYPAPRSPIRETGTTGYTAGADPHTGVYEAPEPERLSPKTLWGVGLAVLALVVGLVLVLDTDDSANQGGDDTSPPPTSQPAAPNEGAAGGGPPARIDRVVFAGPDRFVTLSEAGVHLYETRQQAPLRRLDELDPRRLRDSHLVADPEGGTVAVLRGGPLSVAFVWDLAEAREYEVSLADEFEGGEPMALSPGGRNLYVGPGPESDPRADQVIAYDTHSGEKLYSVDLPVEDTEPGSLKDLGTTPDGELLIAALDSGIAVWDAKSGAPLPDVPEFRPWSGGVSGPMAVSDSLVAVASHHQLLLLDPRSPEAPEAFTVPFNEDETDEEARPLVTSLSFGADGDTVVAAGSVRERLAYLHVWDSDGSPLNERYTESVRYPSVQAAPSGEGVLVAANTRSGQQAPLQLVDDDLSVTREYDLPAVTDEF